MEQQNVQDGTVHDDTIMET